MVVTSGAQADLPSADRLLRCFEGADVGREPAAPLLSIAARLARHHERQWDAEDACRSPAVDDAALGRLKRLIDRYNGQRVDLVDELDHWIAEHLPQDRGAMCHTETYGMVVDRLAIGWVRVRRMTPSPAARAVTAVAARQLAELAAAYDSLVGEVRARRRTLPSWRALKFYRAVSPAAPAGIPAHR